jgi:uncharacterized protein YcbX
MSALTIASLHVYPIKSCRGLDLTAVRLHQLGPLYDRQFMIVDAETSRFVTQREEPRMALIAPRLGPTALQVSAPDMPVLKVPLSGGSASLREVTVWRFTGAAEDVGENAAAWVSEVLQRPCRLVRFRDDVHRFCDPSYAGEGVETSFTDGYPILLTTQASLDDLNSRMRERITMSRFRPNVVVNGTTAFAEDTWKRVRIGEIELDVVKPCARCTITTVDPITAKRAVEPLVTLASYRKRDNEVFFGQNCVHRQMGSIRVGDPVEVLETV